MVIQFSLGNYRSFNTIQTVNFKATGLVSEDKTVDENNIVEENKQRLLKTIGVYGANGSGKSNLIDGLRFFINTVRLSLIDDNYFARATDFFKLGGQDIGNNGFFQIILLLNNKVYRYGFTLIGNSIGSEWLFGTAEENETWYFKRQQGRPIEINPTWFKEGLNLPQDKLRTNTNFLTFCASYDGEISKLIKNYLIINIYIDKIFNKSPSFVNITNKLYDTEQKEIIIKWMNDTGLFCNDIKFETIIGGGEIIGKEIFISKNKYNENGEVIGQVTMYLRKHESVGTQKYYSYIGQLYYLFENGGMFISDEIDSNFHPSLLIKIIGMFNNPLINKAGAQLLFTSHDTNLMQPAIMRRDQFYFAEKTLQDATRLYSLSDLKGVRNNADFAKQYLAGFYGALPVLHNYLEDNNETIL